MQLSFYRMATSGRVLFSFLFFFFDHCYDIGLDLLKESLANIYLGQNSDIFMVINRGIDAIKGNAFRRVGSANFRNFSSILQRNDPWTCHDSDTGGFGVMDPG